MKTLNSVIYSFLEHHPNDFDKCVDELRKLKHDFSYLVPDYNPIAAELSILTKAQIRFIVKEHSVFAKEAIHFLTDSLICCHNWPNLAQEIQDNINEEKGSETKGVPHIEMLRLGYKMDLGINTDRIKSSKTTQKFIAKMRHIFRHTENAYVAGALIALEGTAIPEFTIVDTIAKAYAGRIGKNEVLMGKTLTNLYIDGHKLFEIDHEAHLISAIKPYITGDNIVNMIKGYFAVCLTMQLWWQELHVESYRRRIEAKLVSELSEEVDVKAIFELS